MYPYPNFGFIPKTSFRYSFKKKSIICAAAGKMPPVLWIITK